MRHITDPFLPAKASLKCREDGTRDRDRHTDRLPPPQNWCFQVNKACHTLRTALGEDVLVVADAVLDDVNQTLGHGPPGRLVERDRCKVLDSCVQLEIGVATVGHHRFTLR